MIRPHLLSICIVPFMLLSAPAGVTTGTVAGNTSLSVRQAASADQLQRQLISSATETRTIKEQRFQHAFSALAGSVTAVTVLTVFSTFFFLIVFFYYIYNKNMQYIMGRQTLR